MRRGGAFVLQAFDQLGRARQRAGVGQADQHHLRGLQARRRAPRLAQALEQHLPGARQHRQRQPLRHVSAADPLGLGHAGAFEGLGHQLGAGHEVADLKQVLEHDRRVGAGLVQGAEHLEGLGRSAAHHRLEQVEDPRPVGQAEHGAHRLGLDPAAAGQRDRLVEQRQAVAHRAVGRARDGGQRLAGDLHALGLGDAREMSGQRNLVEPAQVEALAAREHGHRDLARLGGGEDEDDVLGRLLQGLEQAIEGLPREHVHLVDDVDLGARLDRAVAHALDQLADVVDAGAAGRVHLDHVDVAVLGDGDAVLAHPAGLGRRCAAGAVRPDAVERARDDPRGRGLAHPAHAGQDEGLGHAPALQRVGERAHRRVLADQVGEARRPVLARQDLIGPRPGVAGLGVAGLGIGGLGVASLGIGGGWVRHRRAPGGSPWRFAGWEAEPATRTNLVAAASFRT